MSGGILELEGSRKEMCERISQKPDALEARIKAKPSRQLFLRLLEQTRVKKIYMTSGILKTVSKKVVAALEAAGIKIVVLEKKAGRSPKFSLQKKEEALKMINEGQSAKKISKKLGVPTTAIYSWKRREAKAEFSQVPDST